jgi:Replication initiation factor
MPNRRDVKATAVYSGVDWISGSLARDELDNQTWMHDCLHSLIAVHELGNTYKRRALMGFDGWESAGCFVGSNEQRHYAQFAGKYANDAYHMLEHPKVHISRIDLQITVQYDTELVREGRYQYARAIRHNKDLPEHRQRRIHLYAGDDGSDTVYLGAPSSDVRGRIYNKAKQSGEAAFKNSWRYEVVYRNEIAASVYRRINDAGLSAPTVILQEIIAWYAQRGVNVLGVGLGSETPIERLKQPRSDVARKLSWIKHQVVPTIRKLAEMGYAEELMEVIAEAIAAARNGQQ